MEDICNNSDRDYVFYPDVAILVLDRIISNLDAQAVSLFETTEWTEKGDFYSGGAVHQEIERYFTPTPSFNGEEDSGDK